MIDTLIQWVATYLVWRRGVRGVERGGGESRNRALADPGCVIPSRDPLDRVGGTDGNDPSLQPPLPHPETFGIGEFPASPSSPPLHRVDIADCDVFVVKAAEAGSLDRMVQNVVCMFRGNIARRKSAFLVFSSFSHSKT